MRNRQLIALLPLAAGVIALACNSGPSLEGYFDQIEPLFNNASESYAVLDQTLDEKLVAAQSDEEKVLVFQEFVTGSGGVARTLTTQLVSMEPPGEAEEAHEQSSQANADLVELLADLFLKADELESADGLEELMAELQGSEFTAAEELRDDACSKLQEIADAGGLAADLACAEL